MLLFINKGRITFPPPGLIRYYIDTSGQQELPPHREALGSWRNAADLQIMRELGEQTFDGTAGNTEPLFCPFGEGQQGRRGAVVCISLPAQLTPRKQTEDTTIFNSTSVTYAGRRSSLQPLPELLSLFLPLSFSTCKDKTKGSVSLQSHQGICSPSSSSMSLQVCSILHRPSAPVRKAASTQPLCLQALISHSISCCIRPGGGNPIPCPTPHHLFINSCFIILSGIILL